MGGNETDATAAGADAAAAPPDSLDGGLPEPVAPCVQPRIVTAPQLPPAYAGQGYLQILRAACGDEGSVGSRIAVWDALGLPVGLALSADGVLRGIVPPGAHDFVAKVLIEPGVSVERKFSVELAPSRSVVWLGEGEQGRSSDLFAAPMTSLSTPARLTAALDPARDIERFELSPDGRYAAAVIGGGARSLVVVGVDEQARARAPFEIAGEYLAHAFSPDSRWLAWFTRSEQDPALSMLWALDLQAQEWLAIGGLNTAYSAGLTWSLDDTVLFQGQTLLAGAPTALLTAQEVQVPALSSVVTYSKIFNPPDSVLRFFGYRKTASGFLSAAARQLYFFHRDTQTAPLFDGLVTASWDGRLVARVRNERLEIFDSKENRQPAATGGACERLVTWSQDSTWLLCLTQGKYRLLRKLGKEIQEVLAGVIIPSRTQQRMLISGGSNWIAYEAGGPDERSLTVAPLERLGLEVSPVLTASGDARWNLSFTNDETHLIVQFGTELHLVHLFGEGAAQSTTISAQLRPATPCTSDLPSPLGEWCGEARLPESTALSADGRVLAWAEADGVARLTDLAVSTATVTTFGKILDDCGRDCVQLR